MIFEQKTRDNSWAHVAMSLQRSAKLLLVCLYKDSAYLHRIAVGMSRSALAQRDTLQNLLGRAVFVWHYNYLFVLSKDNYVIKFCTSS